MKNPLRTKWLAAAAVTAIVVVPLASPAGSAQRANGGTARSSRPDTLARAKAAAKRPYPVGTPDRASPSDMAPPASNALAGYTLSYVNDFSGTTLPPGWEIFTGNPVGDPGGQWGASHVTVSDGVLSLATWRDPAYGDEWVAGGVSQVGVAHTYGAYFVRSRLTGPGPTQVEMLWPAVGWPPEIDFDETYGNTDTSMATDHFTSANSQIHRTLSINMTQWHTWGVIWTPTKITYTVDGRIWGTVTGAGTVPDQPMSLHLQQQTWCNSNFACPTVPEQTLVDWVAEYTPSLSQSDVIGDFPSNSSSLTPSLESEIEQVAQQIAVDGDPTVSVTAYGDTAVVADASLTLQRASVVSSLLQQDLEQLNLAGIRVTTSSGATVTSTQSSTAPRSSLSNVVIQIH